MSARARVRLPITWRSPPSRAFRARMASRAPSPGIRLVLGQVRSASVRVLETTCFSIAFMASANSSPARSGHASAMTFQVRRPNSSASVAANPSPIAAPMTSGSK